VRQIHRWLSIAFTAAVIVNVVAMAQKEPALWVGLLALLPPRLPPPHRPLPVCSAICRQVAQPGAYQRI